MTNQTKQSALLVMDVQPGIIERVRNQEEFLAKLTETITAARQKNVLVIFGVVGFRPGVPEISSENKMFSSFAQDASSPLINPRPLITPEDADILVVKRRVSLFSGSDLEIILRAQHIRHLILTGIATSGVVLSTVREAADKDYQLSVLSDLCADADPEVHAVLMNKIFPRQAAVLTADEWIQAQ